MKDFGRSDDPRVQAQLDRLARLTLTTGRYTLETMRQLLARLGDPQDQMPPLFHVAGTNGKGSTCAFLRAMLEAQGYKVHVTTSPHLVRYNERIRLAGELISDDALAALLKEVLDAGEDLGPSFFEVTIAAAFLAFSRTQADACIAEVGLGGRLDATNVVALPAVCGIAALGLDHEEFLLRPELGLPTDTDERLAFEKGGIRRSGVPLVALRNAPRANRFLVEAALSEGIPLKLQGDSWNVHADRAALHYHDERDHLTLPLPSLAGAHQTHNAGLAIAMLRAQQALAMSEKAISDGLRSVRWPARLQRLAPGPLQDILPEVPIWVDGGHNRDAGAALAEFIAARDIVPHLIIGMLARKDPSSLMDPLHGDVASVTVVPVAGQECHMVGAFAGWPVESNAATDVKTALGALASIKPEAVLIAGSLYLAGEVLRLNDELPD